MSVVCLRDPEVAAEPWGERCIGRIIARQTFKSRFLVVLNNCNFAGSEADILGVTESGRMIDVEIKVSRSDLKADAAKGKWREWTGWNTAPFPVEWPRGIWKHYYAVPREIWKDELLGCLGSPRSGVLLVSRNHNGDAVVECARRATPNKNAKQLTPAQILDVARLASLRMWDAYAEQDRLHREYQSLRKATAP